MIEKTKTKLYKFAFVKSWFDSGYGSTSIVKYGAGLLGIANFTDVKSYINLLLIGFAYVIFCFILGWVMYHIPSKQHNFMLAEREVANQYDFFAKEVRSKIEGKVFK